MTQYLSVFVILPNEGVVSLRKMSSETLPHHLKSDLELLAGYPAHTYDLCYIGGGISRPEVLTEDITLRIVISPGYDYMMQAVLDSDVKTLTLLSQLSKGRLRLGSLQKGPRWQRCQEFKETLPEDTHFVGLFLACSRGHVNLVKRLLIVGCSAVAEFSPYGRSLLHVSAYHNHTEVVRLLLYRGCNPTWIDREGQSCLDLARECHAATSVAVIEEYRRRSMVDKWSISPSHRSPFHEAGSSSSSGFQSRLFILPLPDRGCSSRCFSAASPRPRYSASSSFSPLLRQEVVPSSSWSPAPYTPRENPRRLTTISLTPSVNVLYVDSSVGRNRLSVERSKSRSLQGVLRCRGIGKPFTSTTDYQ